MRPETLEIIIERYLPEIKKIRRQIHQHPELALQEKQTAKLIRRYLTKTKARVLTPYTGTDVVALLSGRQKGWNVTLRADMDALPLEETGQYEYRSKKKGVMHACGHDGHTAMLIGAVLVLSELTNEFNGSIRFIFQPGEEVVAQARELVAKGVIADPPPAAVFALHGASGIPVGMISAKAGPAMAAADPFLITIKGTGGHGARPEQATDTILTGARVVEALQAIPSRFTSPMDPVVVSVCRFSGGANSNILPETVELEGCVRYFNPLLAKELPRLMERVVRRLRGTV